MKNIKNLFICIFIAAVWICTPSAFSYASQTAPAAEEDSQRRGVIVADEDPEDAMKADVSADDAADREAKTENEGLADTKPVPVMADRANMEIRYGFDNHAKPGKTLPIEIQVQDARIYDGTYRLFVTQNSADIACEYVFPIDIQAGAGRVTEYIPLAKNGRSLSLELRDFQDRIIIEKNEIEIQASPDMPELFVGILSDHPDRLSYLDGIFINRGQLRSRLLELGKDTFPDVVRGLDLLDVIVVNDYELSDLSADQLSALEEWLLGGGVLLFGGGSRAAEAFGPFAEELVSGGLDSTELWMVDLAEEYSSTLGDEGLMALKCSDLALDGGSAVISGNKRNLLYTALHGSGLVGAAVFDLGDIAEFARSEAEYADFLLVRLMGEDRIRRSAMQQENGGQTGLDRLYRIVDGADTDNLPNVALFFTIISLYIVLAGPALYLVLCSRGLQALYGVGVAMLASIFFIIIYLAGSVTRYDGTVLSFASVTDLGNDNAIETVYVNLRSAKKETFSVSFAADREVTPMLREEASHTDAAGGKIRVEQRNETVTVTQEGLPAFYGQMFRLDKKQAADEGMRIEGSLKYQDCALTGTITNATPYALEGAALCMFGKTAYIGRLLPGESIELSGSDCLDSPIGCEDAVAAWLEEKSLAESGKSQKDASTSRRRDLVEYYLSNYFSDYSADARFIAFGGGIPDFMGNSVDAKIYGMSMVTAGIGISYENNSEIFKSLSAKQPSVLSGKFLPGKNASDSSAPVTLEYKLEDGITASKLFFLPVDLEFSNYSVVPFRGMIYIYNHSTGAFDRYELGDDAVCLEGLGPYLSPGNLITVRYVGSGSDQTDAALPVLMVSGRRN